MLSFPFLAALAAVVTTTSFISGIFGMAGGMLLIGFLLVVLPVQTAMVMHGVIQIAANGWRAFLWRQHIKWSVVMRFGAGCATALIVFSFFSFVPDKSVVRIAIGLTPFLALAVPKRIAPNIEGPGQAYMAGLVGGSIQLVAGVTGPLLDIFYVRTGMTRQVNVATKAAAQVTGHLTKILYFGVIVAHPEAHELTEWLATAFAVTFAVIGTNLSRVMLDRMSDKQFYRWTRMVILCVGGMYLAQGLWQLSTR